jgi:hypothetical protein
MQDMFLVVNLLPRHLLVPQLAVSSSMSKRELPSDVFPLMLFPEGQFGERIVRPGSTPVSGVDVGVTPT